MRLAIQNQRGDTLIEVLVATAVFSLLAVSTLVIMNQGIASAQRALELTQVRGQIDGQAATLRYIHALHVGALSRGESTTGDEWSKILTKKRTVATTFGLTPTDTCPAIDASYDFVVNPQTAGLSTVAPQSFASSTDTSTPPYAQLFYTGGGVQSKGLWVEAVQNPANAPAVGQPGFVDFHIRACWDSVGSSVPATIGTIVRLYEPAS